jgi:hypothetical protein
MAFGKNWVSLLYECSMLGYYRATGELFGIMGVIIVYIQDNCPNLFLHVEQIRISRGLRYFTPQKSTSLRPSEGKRVRTIALHPDCRRPKEESCMV